MNVQLSVNKDERDNVKLQYLINFTYRVDKKEGKMGTFQKNDAQKVAKFDFL